MPRCPAPNTYLKTDDAVNGSYSNNVDLHYYGTQIYDMWQSWMNLDVGAEMNKYAGAQGGGGRYMHAGVGGRKRSTFFVWRWVLVGIGDKCMLYGGQME